jgi:hypothetical protein
MSRPRSSVLKMWAALGGSRAVPDAVGGPERSDEQGRNKAIA